jgi:hypothetical protein
MNVLVGFTNSNDRRVRGGDEDIVLNFSTSATDGFYQRGLSAVGILVVDTRQQLVR